jgi:hypothetical protein
MCLEGEQEEKEFLKDRISIVIDMINRSHVEPNLQWQPSTACQTASASREQSHLW